MHEDEFRFEISTSLWETYYLSGRELDAKNILKVVKNDELTGYAIYSLVVFDEAKAYRILEICADERETFANLINRVVEHGIEEGIDFIYFKEDEKRHDDIFEEKGFFSFLESTVMITLLNPKDFFLSISRKIERGRIIKLNIEGFDPISLKVSEKGVQVVKDEKPNATMNIDSKTFLKLLFGRTSFAREFIRRRLTIDSIFDLQAARCLFNQIRQKKWYMPPGDWL